MDPISILSVATAVVTFVDFSAKILSRCREIHKTGKGTSEELVALSTAARDLSNISSRARDGVKDLRSNYPGHAETLQRLTSECAATEKKVKDFLAKLDIDSRGLFGKYTSALVVAVRSTWSKAELENWDKQLAGIREQIMIVVLTCIWDDTRLARERSGRTQEENQKILDAISRIGYDVEAVKKSVSLPKEWRHGVVAEPFPPALWETIGLINFPKDAKQLYPPQASANSPGVEAVLQSLSFSEMSDRGDRIALAYPETFAWLFRENRRLSNDSSATEHTGFLQWLRGHDPTIFWITGVPASGKSTLMKFISNHDSLRPNLRIWAGEFRLHVATFYFWGPGSNIQKSREGLLRSLLHQLLSQRPELVGVVAPRRRTYLDLLPPHQSGPPWDWTELCECFSRFASCAQQTNSRIAMFIDGLDEYEGDVAELVSFLIGLHQKFDLKLCVSSRPWNVFADAFQQSPSLTMENLTGPDIDIYIEQKLSKSPAIEELHVVMPDEVDKLICDIKAKAKGVFLWVVLVVEQLLETSRDNPQLASIREVFNGLPDELEALYNKIQDQIGPEKQRVASRLYQLLMEWKRTWNSRIPATFLWLAINIADPKEHLLYPEADKEQGITKLLDRLLKGHTKGILQISKDEFNESSHTVDFLHRTTFEWLRIEGNWSRISNQSGENYQPMLHLLRVLVSHFRSLPPLKAGLEFDVQYINRIFKLASDVPDTLVARSQLVPIIDDIDQGCFQALIDHGYSFYMTSKEPSCPLPVNAMTCAAAWSCLTYLHGKLDNQQNLRKRRLLSKFTHSPLQPLLDLALFSFDESSSLNLHYYEWYIRSRYLHVENSSKRLETIQLLLQRGARINRSQLRRLKDLFQSTVFRGTKTHRYAGLLLDAKSSSNVAASLEKLRLGAFPADLVAADRSAREFPRHYIGIEPASSYRTGRFI